MVSSYGRSRARAFPFLAMSLVLAIGMLIAAAGQSFAQEATPEPIAADLPTIVVTANETVFQISVPPTGVIEGDFVVQLVNETANNIANANFVKLPEGTSVGDFTSVIAKSFKGAGGDLPDWWTEAEFAGGTATAPGTTSESIVTLTAGRWVVFSSNPGGVQSAQIINVVTEAEANGEEATPEASPVVESFPSDNQIVIGADGITTASEPSADQVVWQVTNETEQVSDLVIINVAADTTPDVAAQIAAAYSSGNTVNGLVVGSSGSLSPDATSYVGAQLTSGTYLLFSSFPDATGGLQSANGGLTLITIP